MRNKNTERSAELRRLKSCIKAVKIFKKFAISDREAQLIKKYDPVYLKLMAEAEAEIYIQAGLILRELVSYPLALTYWAKAIKLDPKNILALTLKADLLLELTKYSRSIEACDDVLRVDSSITIAYADKGIGLYHLRSYYEALNSFDAALKYEPSNPIIIRNKANTLIKLGKIDAAVSCFAKAIEAESMYQSSSFIDEFLQIRELDPVSFVYLEPDPATVEIDQEKLPEHNKKLKCDKAENLLTGTSNDSSNCLHLLNQTEEQEALYHKSQKEKQTELDLSATLFETEPQLSTSNMSNTLDELGLSEFNHLPAPLSPFDNLPDNFSDEVPKFGWLFLHNNQELFPDSYDVNDLDGYLTLDSLHD